VVPYHRRACETRKEINLGLGLDSSMEPSLYEFPCDIDSFEPALPCIARNRVLSSIKHIMRDKKARESSRACLTPSEISGRISVRRYVAVILRAAIIGRRSFHGRLQNFFPAYLRG
jgi:hypothetical protein